MKTCSQPDCERTDLQGRGLCGKHYQRFRYHGSLAAVAPLRTTCVVCEKPLPTDHANRIYCSRLCNDRAALARLRASRVRRAVACDQCGMSLADKRPQSRFCSNKCSNDFRNAASAAKRRTDRKPCAHCGQPTPLGAKRFCSRECYMAHRRPEKYGLSQDELEALLAQHNVCALCGTDQWGRKGPQVDHDHVTGRVRGVLCVNCNTLLGHAKDDPARLRAALDYLTP